MDAAHPKVTALAIRGDQIVAVGTDDVIREYVAPSTKVIELHGHAVTPGLVDAHAHLYGLGVDLEQISLRELDSEAATAQRVIDAEPTAAGPWIVGRGWDQNRWPGQQFPSHRSLDAIGRPVLLRRIDGHAIWVNSAALKAAGITKDTKDPAGGRIVRDANGPTGVLIDNAVDLVDKVMPVATPEQRRARIERAMQQAIATGMTGVHEMGIEAETAEAYRALDLAHPLPLRVYAFLLGDPAKPPTAPPATPTPHFSMRGVKFFADGALGSRGARLYADYDDDKGNRGLWVTEPAQLIAAVDGAVAHGWQVATHAIGDAANGAVLDAYLAASAAHPGDHRLRIEHVQVISAADLDRLKIANAIASMQPTHATSDMPWAEARIGHARIAGAYAWRAMLDKQIPLAFGSDFPVEDVGPLLGLYAAVTRQDATGKPDGGWYPAQKLTLTEAIAGFTTGAAYAEFADAHRGVIAVGRTADVTVFDRALAADHTLLETHADYTIVDGQIRFQRGAK